MTDVKRLEGLIEQCREARKAKQRFSEGRHGQVAYHLSPRYSTWNPTTSSSQGMEKFLESERKCYAMAIEGQLGEDMESIAKEKGLRGLVAEVQQTAAGWLYTSDDGSWLRLDPDEDLTGLWKLRRGVANDNSDGRVKNDWRMRDFWEEGTRFLLSRNVMAFDARLNDLSEERGVPELEEKDLAPDEVADLRKKSGYLISIVGDSYNESRLDKMSDFFIQSLKPVPIDTAQAAIEVARVGEYHIRKVLEHLVDVKGKFTPWHLATLLEQSDYHEGPFAKKEDDA